MAFGYWAGYVGAALAVLQHRGELTAPLVSSSREELLTRRLAPGRRVGAATAVVIGAYGRSGRGACDALGSAGIEPVRWGPDDTRGLNRNVLLAHDILVNTIGCRRLVPPFLTKADLDGERRLAVIADVTCDVGSELNTLPIYDHVTDWDNPVASCAGVPGPWTSSPSTTSPPSSRPRPAGHSPLTCGPFCCRCGRDHKSGTAAWMRSTMLWPHSVSGADAPEPARDPHRGTQRATARRTPGVTHHGLRGARRQDLAQDLLGPRAVAELELAATQDLLRQPASEGVPQQLLLLDSRNDHLVLRRDRPGQLDDVPGRPASDTDSNHLAIEDHANTLLGEHAVDGQFLEQARFDVLLARRP